MVGSEEEAGAKECLQVEVFRLELTGWILTQQRYDIIDFVSKEVKSGNTLKID